ncbi:DUF3396 domain-containing protein [Pigmentiphaga aceris]|uniref:DUF3396 domain-containing protein n=1 Tax=Pigmentiphaga aceris TaxID=1940612 RepID=A0A5C0AV97_9BURK|nr:type VI immunity family protein [Pigmentiphaga aceris]QEI06115.1 DUF3396 domain-containing protein [Pigmentiphaga aceris]
MNALDRLSQHAPDLSFELPDGKPVVKLGLILTLYFKNGYTRDTKERLLACFRRFHEAYRPALNCLIYRRHQKLTDPAFEKACDAILKLGGHEEFSLCLSSAADDTQAADYSLTALNSAEIHGDGLRSFIKMVMPWHMLADLDGRATFLAWAQYLCDQVKAEHGYGGLSSVLPHDYHGYLPAEYQLAQQYSGLEVDSMPHASSIELLDAVKGVNWLTVLGQDFLQRVGGEHAIAQALHDHEDSDVLTYCNGLIVQAGGYPELGRDELPAAYVAVNKVVRPIRIKQPDQLHFDTTGGKSFDQADTTKWYARFDQDDARQD